MFTATSVPNVECDKVKVIYACLLQYTIRVGKENQGNSTQDRCLNIYQIRKNKL